MSFSASFPIAVVGAGTMGANIALDLAAHGHPILIAEIDAAQRERARAVIAEGAETLARHGLLGESPAAVAARIGFSNSPAEAAASARWTIEAVAENLEAKRRVFREIESACPSDAVIASNTSTFLPSDLAAVLARPGRALVAHFWNPAHLIPLVEIVPHPGTDPATIAEVSRELERCGKRPVVLRKETPGFIGNRLAFALQREAMALVAQGIASPSEIDLVVRTGFGRRVPVTGVFATADLGGLDVYLAVCRSIFPLLDNGSVPPAALAALVAAGRLGMKSGAGWSDYEPEQVRVLRNALENELIGRAAGDQKRVEGDF